MFDIKLSSRPLEERNDELKAREESLNVNDFCSVVSEEVGEGNVFYWKSHRDHKVNYISLSLSLSACRRSIGRKSFEAFCSPSSRVANETCGDVN